MLQMESDEFIDDPLILFVLKLFDTDDVPEAIFVGKETRCLAAYRLVLRVSLEILLFKQLLLAFE